MHFHISTTHTPQSSNINPLGHLSIGVRNYDVSKAFYTAVLAPLGLKLVYDSEAEAADSHKNTTTENTTTTASDTASVSTNSDSLKTATKKKSAARTLGYGSDPRHEALNIFEFGPAASPPGPGFHLAFNAPTRQAVVEFHAQAMMAGGTDNGLPGVRKHYGGDYFAAFVVDPDGWRLEAVCKGKH